MKKIMIIAGLLASLMLTACTAKSADNAGDDVTVPTKGAETEATTETNSEDTDSFFAQFKSTDFSFSSGAGAWVTSFEVDENGHFKGSYMDTDMGTPETDNAHIVRYCCDFEGDFAKPEKIDDYTYKTSIVNITFAQEPGTEEVKNDTRFVYTEPYGLDGGKDFYFYMEGKPLDSIDEEVLIWVQSAWLDTPNPDKDIKELPFTVFVNENQHFGFSSAEE